MTRYIQCSLYILALILPKVVLATSSESVDAMPNGVNNTSALSLPTNTYFRSDLASNLLYAHITCMIAGWIGVLPVGKFVLT